MRLIPLLPLALLVACSGARPEPDAAPATKDAPRTMRECRKTFNGCTERCRQGSFTYVGGGVWLGDWNGALDCNRACRERANACATGVRSKSPTTGRPTPGTHPGVWIAEYFADVEHKSSKLVRTEPVIDLAAAPLKSLPENYSVRWMLQEQLDPGLYRLVVRTDGAVTVKLDGEALALRPVDLGEQVLEGPALLRTDDVPMGTGRKVTVELVNTGETKRLWAAWLRVDEGEAPASE